MPTHTRGDQDDPDFPKLVTRIGDHLETRLEYTRLVVFEKIAVASVKTASAGIMLKLFSLFFFFFSVAIAAWIGRYYDDYVIGFGAVALFYLLVLLVYLALRKLLFEKKMLVSVVKTLCAEHENDDDDDDEA